MNYLQITGSQCWRLLHKKVVQSKKVKIVDCDNQPPIGPQSFDAEEVYFKHCNGNHLYYWLKPTKFPNVKKIYLDCPYEPMVYLTDDTILDKHDKVLWMTKDIMEKTFENINIE